MKKIILIMAILGILGVSSCDTKFLDLPNPSAYSSDTYFDGATATTYKGLTTAIYSGLMNQGLFARDWYFYLDMLGNEVEPTNAMLGENRVMCNYSYQPDNGYLTLLWQYLYQVQHRSNFAISVMSKWVPASESEQTQKDYFTGESNFFQGFIYYHLAALYGAAPLYETYEEVLANKMKARSTRTQVYAYAEKQLKAAIDLLPPTWPSVDNGRATKWAAKAYLAQLYMQTGNYNEAIPILEDIITNGGFSVWPGLKGFHRQFQKENRNSPETIFDIKYAWYGTANANKNFEWGYFESSGNNMAAHTGRGIEYGDKDWSNCYVTFNAVHKFKYNINAVTDYIDPRASETFYGDGDATVGFYGGDTYRFGPKAAPVTDGEAFSFSAGTFYWRWKKYQNYEYQVMQDNNSEISCQMMRLNGVRLMLAESYILSTTPQYTKALTQINLVRSRAGAVEYLSIPATKTGAMDLLMRERSLEQTGEQVRWFDLLRWDAAGVINMKTQINFEKLTVNGKPDYANFDDKHRLLPIPQTERDVNKNCVAPDGWNGSASIN